MLCCNLQNIRSPLNNICSTLALAVSCVCCVCLWGAARSPAREVRQLSVFMLMLAPDEGGFGGWCCWCALWGFFFSGVWMSASSQAVFLQCKCKTDVGETLRGFLLCYSCLLLLGSWKYASGMKVERQRRTGEGNASSTPCYRFLGLLGCYRQSWTLSMNGHEGIRCCPCSVHGAGTNPIVPEAPQNCVLLSWLAACPKSCPGNPAVLQSGVKVVRGDLAYNVT